MKKQHLKHLMENRRTKVVFPVLLILFSLGFGIGTYKVITILHEDKYVDTAYNELRVQLREQSVKPNGATESSGAVTEGLPSQRQRSLDIRPLQETYPELKAWILAEGTGIDYPIMQAADNQYYLSHLYDGTKNSNGSLFVDYRNTGMFTDDNTVIYGHHMKNGLMFQPLSEYKEQDFYEAHPTMMIYTTEGDYLVELICGTIEDGNYEFVRFSFDDFNDMSSYVDELKERSTFKSEVTLRPGDKLVSMCTCSYERQNARYMLVGRIVELYEP